MSRLHTAKENIQARIHHRNKSRQDHNLPRTNSSRSERIAQCIRVLLGRVWSSHHMGQPDNDHQDTSAHPRKADHDHTRKDADLALCHPHRHLLGSLHRAHSNHPHLNPRSYRAASPYCNRVPKEPRKPPWRAYRRPSISSATPQLSFRTPHSPTRGTRWGTLPSIGRSQFK